MVDKVVIIGQGNAIHKDIETVLNVIIVEVKGSGDSLCCAQL